MLSVGPQDIAPKQTMAPNKVRRLYHQKYREDWERFPSFAPWLCRGDDGYSAHCKICDANVLARLASIKQHNNAVKHQKAMKSYIPGVPTMRQQIMARVEAKPIPPKFFAAKQKPKVKRIKVEKIDPPEPPIEQDACSNDSILEDLLGNEEGFEQEYEITEEVIEHEHEHEQNIKQEMLMPEYKMDETNDEIIMDDNIISEFDLFGNSVSLQLNHMDLEDALLCQERLQVVLTEFRLKILKRKAKLSF
ncbi:uncharacterized protein LOC132798691 [Drosophila nasuta]|uniref:uncharacterized protein LOC132798691 n=1 Tax=Drosophila nasuta TaxID=42062 RepID=UPI00295E5712|nr:uncharacterized protein LOC132798691 [Drosophila nasuta]